MMDFVGCAFLLKIEKKLILRNNKRLMKMSMQFAIYFDIFLKIIIIFHFHNFDFLEN